VTWVHVLSPHWRVHVVSPVLRRRWLWLHTCQKTWRIGYRGPGPNGFDCAEEWAAVDSIGTQMPRGSEPRASRRSAEGTRVPQAPLGAIFMAALLLLNAFQACAAVFFVSPDGNDAASGTEASPFRTVQKALSVAGPGDTLVLLPGEYGEQVAICRNGAEANPITIEGRGEVKITNGWMVGTYSVPCHNVVIRGLTFRGAGLAIKGSSNVVEHCIFEGPVGGLSVSPHPTADPAAEYVVVRGNVFRDFGKVVVTGTGTKTRNVLIESNAWYNLEGDVIRMFGVGHIFRYNVISNVMETGFHADIFQVYGNNNEQSLDMLVEGNFFCKSSGSIAMLQNRQGAPIGRWTFRNNVFFRVTGTAQISIPYCSVVNNTFVESGQNTAGPILLRYDVDVEWGYAHHTRIFNNLFVGCSSRPDGDDLGWYHFADRPSSVFVGFEADYNFVSKSAAAGYGPKAGFRGVEKNGINGGDPLFVDPMLGDFRLRAGSALLDNALPLRDFSWDMRGLPRPSGAGWDRGALEGAFVNEVVTPPSDLRVVR